MRAIEDGQGERGVLADLISTAIVRLHLATMLRLGIEYDLLVQESEILKLDFWKSAFELMKNAGAVRYEDSGKNRGCWVMNLGESTEPESPEEAAQPETAEDVKVIVRSNGTVTYVGKDIAYHLWKFGLLGRDFGYQPFYACPDGHTVWRTRVPLVGESATSSAEQSPRPEFGGAAAARGRGGADIHIVIPVAIGIPRHADTAGGIGGDGRVPFVAGRFGDGSGFRERIPVLRGGEDGRAPVAPTLPGHPHASFRIGGRGRIDIRAGLGG